MGKQIVEHWNGIGKAHNLLFQEYHKAIEIAEANGNKKLASTLKRSFKRIAITDHEVLKKICELQ
jgi:hypothetical protein